jgi:hypothetical protein
MSPDKTAMSLDSLSIVTTDQNDNVNIPQAYIYNMMYVIDAISTYQDMSELQAPLN